MTYISSWTTCCYRHRLDITSCLGMQVDSIYTESMSQHHCTLRNVLDHSVAQEILSITWGHFLETVLKANFGEKTESELKVWIWPKRKMRFKLGAMGPCGWQGPRTFFGMIKIRDADASKKTKLVTPWGAEKIGFKESNPISNKTKYFRLRLTDEIS